MTGTRLIRTKVQLNDRTTSLMHYHLRTLSNQWAPVEPSHNPESNVVQFICFPHKFPMQVLKTSPALLGKHGETLSFEVTPTVVAVA